jgi:hypothetical protein
VKMSMSVGNMSIMPIGENQMPIAMHVFHFLVKQMPIGEKQMPIGEPVPESRRR